MPFPERYSMPELLSERDAAMRRLRELRDQAYRFRTLADQAERELADLRSTFGAFPGSGEYRLLTDAEERVALNGQATVNAARIADEAEREFVRQFGEPPPSEDEIDADGLYRRIRVYFRIRDGPASMRL